MKHINTKYKSAEVFVDRVALVATNPVFVELWQRRKPLSITRRISVYNLLQAVQRDSKHVSPDQIEL